MTTDKPTLYLLPAPISDSSVELAVPVGALQIIRELRDFIVEREKTARAILKRYDMPCAISELSMYRYDEQSTAADAIRCLEPLQQGRSVAMLSEAGCPAVADPGAAVVAAARQAGFLLRPLVGPSAIIMALMASGLNGQKFSFCGYLPRESAARTAELKRLAAEVVKSSATQIFIEAPYRNEAMFSAALGAVADNLYLGVACDISGPEECIEVRTIADWKSGPAPSIHKRPVIFLLGQVAQ